ncbi:MAG: hypothetical protein FWB95_08250 [Treponema sp.]|nr:hypothetical protein [Treponema sp.]
MVKKEKKNVPSRDKPAVNARCGDYNRDNIISIKAHKQHNPIKSDNTIRAYSIPMTAKQEAAKIGINDNL